jgi:PilZ domain
MSEDSTKKHDGSSLETRRSLEPMPIARKPQEDPLPSQDSEPRSESSSKKRSWLRRFLAGEPSDSRRGDREAIPGLVAYFFTGGGPVAHQVQDISKEGIYVLTKERWYPDTLIRLTLSDEREPSAEMSLTLHARVARSGSNGVGFEFVLFEKKDLEKSAASQVEDKTLLVSRAQYHKFLRRFKSAIRDRS